MLSIWGSNVVCVAFADQILYHRKSGNSSRAFVCNSFRTSWS